MPPDYEVLGAGNLSRDEVAGILGVTQAVDLADDVQLQISTLDLRGDLEAASESTPGAVQVEVLLVLVRPEEYIPFADELDPSLVIVLGVAEFVDHVHRVALRESSFELAGAVDGDSSAGHGGLGLRKRSIYVELSALPELP